MKKIILLILGLLIKILVFSQEIQDVVYLKNGSIIKGTIVKQDINKEVIIRTSDGNLFMFQYFEIEQILKKHELNLDEYGGSFSSGVAIGGGGVFGLPMRYHTSSSRFAFELGLYYRPGYFRVKGYYGSSTDYFVHSGVLSLGSNFYLGKHYKEKKQKIKLNGITIKGGIGMGEFNTLFAATGWIHESFKKRNKKKSFTLELGIGLIYTEFSAKGNNLYNSSLGPYWKLQWNWYKK